MNPLWEYIAMFVICALIFFFAVLLVKFRYQANKEQAERNTIAITTQVDKYDVEMLTACLSDRVAPIVGDDDHIKEVLLAQLIPELKKYVSLMDISEYDGTHIKVMILNVAYVAR